MPRRIANIRDLEVALREEVRTHVNSVGLLTNTSDLRRKTAEVAHIQMTDANTTSNNYRIPPHQVLWAANIGGGVTAFALKGPGQRRNAVYMDVNSFRTEMQLADMGSTIFINADVDQMWIVDTPVAGQWTIDFGTDEKVIHFISALHPNTAAYNLGWTWTEINSGGA